MISNWRPERDTTPMANKLTPIEQLIVYDGDVVRFKGVRDSSAGREELIAVASAPFAQPNKPGSLRSVATLEDACTEGQKIAMKLQRIFG